MNPAVKYSSQSNGYFKIYISTGPRQQSQHTESRFLSDHSSASIHWVQRRKWNEAHLHWRLIYAPCRIRMRTEPFSDSLQMRTQTQQREKYHWKSGSSEKTTKRTLHRHLKWRKVSKSVFARKYEITSVYRFPGRHVDAGILARHAAL